MNKELIKDYFLRERKFRGIKRELEVKGVKDKAISILGPRRAGKTWYMLYLLNNFYQDSLYVNFEDLAFRNIKAEEFFEILKIFVEVKGFSPKTLLLDEIQLVKDWESLVRTLIDRDYRIFITGSSSKLLPKEIATQLRGRTISYLLLPFSFREFLIANKFEIKEYYIFEERGKLLRLLDRYLKEGGYPEVVFSDEKEKLLKRYFDEIFLSDFVERHKIKSFELGRFLFEFIFQNFGKEISINKIGKNIKERVSFTNRTLYDYIDKLQDTLNVFFVDKFSKSVYIRRSWPKKVYIVDTGISVLVRFSQDIGKLMENCVFLELLRKTNIYPLIEIFYFKDYQQNEVDFVIKEGLEIKQLIQVTYASNKDEIEKREIKALIKASELLKCKDLLIITWDYEDEINFENKTIKCIPLWKWLVLEAKNNYM
ncbi:MAG: ATP-binding protein [Candidatus Aenigmatarchaeota archaeon]